MDADDFSDRRRAAEGFNYAGGWFHNHRIVAIFTTKARKFVAIIETDAISRFRYGKGMLLEWLQAVMKAKDLSQAELARLLTETLGRNVDRAAVNKMLKGGRDIAGDELLAIEKITGFSAPKMVQVRLAGRVGAGSIVIPFDNPGEHYVEAPAETKPNTVAVEVLGDSMFPAFEDGTLLYYSEQLPPEHLVNQRCIVELEDGRAFVKILRQGSSRGLWTLQSINSLYPDLEDQVVRWAAPIDWTKPRRR